MSWGSRSLETTWDLLYIIVLGMLRDKARKLPEGSRPRPRRTAVRSSVRGAEKEGSPADWDGRASKGGLLLQGTPLLRPRFLKEGRGLGGGQGP